MAIQINAATRLTAAKADKKTALKLLEKLGFTGLQFRSDADNRIWFSYETVDKRKLNQQLGQATRTKSYVEYAYGNQGSVLLLEKTKSVALENKKSKQPKPKLSTKKGIEIHFNSGEQEEAFFEVFDKARFGKSLPAEQVAKISAQPAAYTIHLPDSAQIRVAHVGGKSYIIEIGVGGEDDRVTESKVAGKQLDSLIDKADAAANSAS